MDLEIDMAYTSQMAREITIIGKYCSKNNILILNISKFFQYYIAFHNLKPTTTFYFISDIVAGGLYYDLHYVLHKY